MQQATTSALAVPDGVLRALLEGEVLIDVRPAGRDAAAPSGSVWLRPGGDAPLKPAYRLARQLSTADEAPPEGTVRIEGWARVVARATTRLDADRVAALDSKTVLALDRLAEDVGGGDVDVVALRVHRLDRPLDVAADLSDLPGDPGGAGGEPALSDVAFEAKLKGVADALPGGLSPVGS